MSEFHRRSLSTPRLLVVGLVVLGACHSASAPTTKPQPAAAPPSSTTKPPASAPGNVALAVTNGATLARAIHDRYAANAPRNVTFVQKTTVILSSGSQIVQTWNTAGELPGRWRVETDPSSKNGSLYLGDSTYVFAGGKLAKADTGINEILSIAFDVFSQPATKSEAMLRRMGIDGTKLHEGTWRGAVVYVLGAVRGDTNTKQLWVERDRLIPVRLLENARQGHTEYRFNNYTQVGGEWVPGEIEQYVNGKRRLLETLTQVRTNVSLPDALFDPKRWSMAPHWTP
jgi:hypothetical protein